MSTFYIVPESDDRLPSRFVDVDPDDYDDIAFFIEVVNLDGMHSEDAFFRGVELGRMSDTLLFFDSLDDAVNHVASILEGNQNDVVQ